jgi:hypothetical protein
LVTLTIHNPGTTAIHVPDLAQRPWMVRFTLSHPDGRTEHRSNTPPSTDPGQRVTLAPGGTRQTVLELPSGERLPAGHHRLSVALHDGESPVDLPQRSLHIRPARPVGGMLDGDPVGGTRRSLDSVWLHQAGRGVELYLHRADPRDPTQGMGSFHLIHQARAESPRLAVTSATRSQARHIIWTTRPGTLKIAQLAGHSLATRIENVALPWPGSVRLGSPAMDVAGRLHQLLWVPAPRSAGGDVRLITLGERGALRHRKGIRLATKPTHVDAQVDPSGRVRFLVGTPTEVHHLGIGEEVHTRADRVLAPRQTLAALRFIDDPARPGELLGLAALIEAVPGEPALLHLVTGDTRGRELTRDTQHWARGDRLLGMLPATPEHPAALLGQDKGGKIFLQQADRRHPVPGSLPQPWVLNRGQEGQVILRMLANGGPVATRVFAPE